MAGRRYAVVDDGMIIKGQVRQTGDVVTLSQREADQFKACGFPLIEKDSDSEPHDDESDID